MAEPRIYLDYQASTPVDSRVVEEMMPFFGDKPGNPHGEHAFAWEARGAVDSAIALISRHIGADNDEFFFTSGATEANNAVILGVAARASRDRRRILVGAIEHKCVLEAASAASRLFGISVEHIPVDGEGRVLPKQLEARLGDDVLLVSVMAANNEVGSIQPIPQLADLAHNSGALFHTDATQLLPIANVDVKQLGVDFLSFTAHKLYGPKGIGGLFVSREARSRVEPLIYGGGQQDGFRAGTLPVPLCVGFARAMDIIEDDHSERARIKSLRDNLVVRVLRLDPEFRLNGPALNDRHPGNANICFRGYDARSLLSVLQPTLAVSTGSACTSGIEESSYVLRAMGLSEEDAWASLRFGIGRQTTEVEIDQAVILIERALERSLVLEARS